jgi:dTDP-4-dehydrorhamnose 3,5-epimerase
MSEILSTRLDGLLIIKKKFNQDIRGSFVNFMPPEFLNKELWNAGAKQVNISNNKIAGTIRGMHFQLPPYEDAKLVGCIKGRVFDVVIDMRINSSTYMQWEAVELSDKNGISLLIPNGFAHGFQTLEDESELLYCHSNIYKIDCESGINPMDPMVNISWPLPITLISEKDKNRSFIKGLNR